MRFALLAMPLLFAGGCKTPSVISNLQTPFSRPSVAQSTGDNRIDENAGPIERLMYKTGLKKQEAGPVVLNSEGRDEYDAAVKVYEAGDFQAAEKEFKRLAKTYKNSTVREDALFMKAESQFSQEKYSWAQDSYDELLKGYPSTRHLDVVTHRLFKIAKTWLGQPEFATTENIQQVNLEDPRSSEPPKKEKFPHSAPLVPNLTDRSRPAFDTPGRALQALKSIWLNDPTGPLADDALMLEATYYLRTGRYFDADRVFGILREEYPKSDHLQTAFVLGSHVKLMSYQGAGYDGKTLEEARQLKESTLRLFPNAPEADMIRTELNNIEEAKAQRDWDVVTFYRKKQNSKAMAIYCYEILKHYPETSYAKKAHETLVDLGLERGETVADNDGGRPMPGESERKTDEDSSADPSADPVFVPDNFRREAVPPSLLPQSKPTPVPQAQPVPDSTPSPQPRTPAVAPPNRLPPSPGRKLPRRLVPIEADAEPAGRVKL